MVFDILSRRNKDSEKYGDRLPPARRWWRTGRCSRTAGRRASSWTSGSPASGLVEKDIDFNWEQFDGAAGTKVHCDIHCVTSWSRLDNDFEGVAVPELLKHVKVKPEAKRGDGALLRRATRRTC